MMRRILLAAFLLLAGFQLRAQQSLELYYIAHDHYEAELTKKLNVVRQNARYNTNKTVIFYLANINNPVWMVVSPNDEQAYQAFIDNLNGQSSHNIYPEVDRMKLIEILSDKKLTKGRDLSSFRSIVLNFYITPSFATLGYGDSLIGRLYWDLELDAIKDKLDINIYHHEDDGYDYEENQLFGRKNFFHGSYPLIDTF